jgi:hypothetical protein
VNCDQCDAEFETEAELDRHKAEMHASEPTSKDDLKDDVPAMEDEELEEPAYKRAANE